jgi:hypothetical protein
VQSFSFPDKLDFLSFSGLLSRVARWFVIKPKIPIWVNFGLAMKNIVFIVYYIYIYIYIYIFVTIYFETIWSILWPLEIFYAHLEQFGVLWYIYPRFGILCQEKSGNPVAFACLTTMMERLTAKIPEGKGRFLPT